MHVSPMAILRFQVISAYLADDPPRGQRGAKRAQLADKTWLLPDGSQRQFTAETIRSWVRRYRDGGLAALEDKPRAQRGTVALTEQQIELFCELKREVPERSLGRLIRIAEEMELVPKGVVRRSTLHRALHQRGLSGRPKPDATVTDLDRWEADFPNELWQSDMLAGPWLPDPAKPDKKRRAWLYAFLDDHSRKLLYGRFSFKGDLPGLELCFRQAIRKCGVPRRVYYDNGAVYRAKHMQQVCAALGVHRVHFTTPYRPQGHGKIEAFNRLCRAAFIAEVKASSITTLEQLNQAFAVWAERFYNQRVHGETQEAPRDRWRAGLDRVQHVEERALREAFQWSEHRKTDKTGIFGLHGRRFQVSAELSRKKVEVRYDPEHIDLVEVWFDGRFRERLTPFEVQRHRRPKAAQPTQEDREPIADWLGHMVGQHAQEGPYDPADELREELARRAEANAIVARILRDRIDPEVYDEAIVTDFLERHGPYEPGPADELIVMTVEQIGTGQHVRAYLEALETAQQGGLLL